MKNLQQIKIINKALHKERDKHLFEIHKINVGIERKKATIRKLKSYQREYADGKKFKLSLSIPVLNKNYDSFNNKINSIIDKEEEEIQQLLKIRQSKFQILNKVEQKIKLMEHFSAEINYAAFLKAEKNEQNTLDELSAILHSRGAHD